MSEINNAYKRFEALVADGIHLTGVGYPSGVTVDDIGTFYEWDSETCEDSFAELCEFHKVEQTYSVKDFLEGNFIDDSELSGDLTFKEIRFEQEDWED